VSDVVKAEVRAVRTLKKAVTRYTEQLSTAAHAARREMADAETKAGELVEHRRRQMNRAVQELLQAKDAMARATDEKREDCRRAMVAAEERAGQLKQELERARRAGQITATASSDLLKALQTAEAAVSEQSSADSSILASLDSKLSDITGGGIGAFVRNTVTSIGIAAEITIATMDISKAAGNFSQGRLPTADHINSIAELRDMQDQEQQQLWRDAESERQEHDASTPTENTI